MKPKPRRHEREGWVASRSRKPPAGRGALVYDEGTNCVFAGFWDGKRWWEWQAHDGAVDRPLQFRVRHWMPMPAAPARRRKGKR